MKKIGRKIWFNSYQIGLILILTLLSACVSKSENEQAQPFLRELNIIENTTSYSFKGEVMRGETFEKALPNNLVFKLIPTGYAEVGWMGWNIYIGPTSELAQNYAGIVTPPFRGINTLEIIGWHFRNEDNTGQNDGSVNAPQEERGFNFVLREADYEAASEAVECIMWSSLCKNMDVQEAIDLHQRVPVATGTLRITKLELGNLKAEEQAWIENMEFEVELNLPADLEK